MTGMMIITRHFDYWHYSCLLLSVFRILKICVYIYPIYVSSFTVHIIVYLTHQNVDTHSRMRREGVCVYYISTKYNSAKRLRRTNYNSNNKIIIKKSSSDTVKFSINTHHPDHREDSCDMSMCRQF